MSDPQPAIDPRTAHLLKKFVLGGAALGGGIGLTTSLANYLKYMSDKANVNDSSQDDDILYVDVPEEQINKGANVSGWPGVGSGVAMAGGAVSLLVANALVKKLYNKFKKKQLQQDLDQAQQVYWEDLPKEAAAGKPMSGLETLAGIPVSLTLLAALASGALTKKTLDHYFPKSEASERPDNKPKEVKLRSRPAAPALTDDEGKVVEASTQEMLLTQDLVISSLLEGMDKRASALPDLVHAVAKGRLKELEDSVVDNGIKTTLALCKGASLYSDVSDLEKWAAIAMINRSPELSDTARVLLATEVEDNLPFFSKQASNLAEEDRDVVIKLASLAYSPMADALVNEATHRMEMLGQGDEGLEAQAPKKEGGYQVLRDMMRAAEVSAANERQKKIDDEDIIDRAISAQ
jgi:hypothetical protein